DAELASGAVLCRDLDCINVVGQFAPFGRHVLKRVRGLLDQGLLVGFGTDRGVRAHHYTLAALNTEVRLPYGHFLSDVPFFDGGRADRVGTISRKCANWQGVSPALTERRYEAGGGRRVLEGGCRFASGLATELRTRNSSRLKHRSDIAAVWGCVIGSTWNSKLDEVLDCQVNGLPVLGQHGVAAFAICLLDRLFDPLQRLVKRYDPGYREKAGLHYRIDPRAESGSP